MTLFQFYKQFDTEQKCVDYLIKVRWGGKIICPHCGHNRHYITSCRHRNRVNIYKERALFEFKCANNKCYKKFTATTGTMLHAAKVPLWQFFYLLFSSAINKKNVSSFQQALNLGIAQKTTWYIMMRIRMMCYQDANLKLDGTIEVDETYLAAGRLKRHRVLAGKKMPLVCGRRIPVLGLLQRKGKVIVRVIPNKYRRTVQDVILKHVETGSNLFTDSAACYLNLDSYYLHETVNHREGEYVRGHVHTNSIENFWHNIKHAIMGTHGGVSIEHLQRYCDEVAYRWNNKGMSPLERFNDLLKRACSLRPTLAGKVSLGAMAARKQKALSRKMIA